MPVSRWYSESFLGAVEVILCRVRHLFLSADDNDSAVLADILGDSLLRATNPVVATYARAEAVDHELAADRRAARTGADSAAARVRPVEILREN